MKKIRVEIILVVALIALLAWLALKQNLTGAASHSQNNLVAGQSKNSARPPVVSENIAAHLAPENLAARAGEQFPPPTVATDIPPLIVLQNARRAIAQYAQVFGSNPVGVNSEITAALTGKNPRQINFIPADAGLRINEQGELLDAWGTPLFFHQVSGHEMEIHSAGEDRKLWTFDDLVVR
jgi:hypothetical protein